MPKLGIVQMLLTLLLSSFSSSSSLLLLLYHAITLVQWMIRLRKDHYDETWRFNESFGIF